MLTIVIVFAMAGCTGSTESGCRQGRSKDLADGIVRPIGFDISRSGLAESHPQLVGTLDFDGTFWEVALEPSDAIPGPGSITGTATRVSDERIRLVLDGGVDMSVAGPMTCE